MTREEAINSFKKSNELTKINIEVHRHIMDTSDVRELEWYIERDKMAIEALEQEPCREQDDYENEIEDLHNRLDIAEYDKERLREEVTSLEEKIKTSEQEPKTNVLDKIRAEIEKAKAIMNEEIIEHDRKDLINFINGINQCLVIIDKYRG